MDDATLLLWIERGKTLSFLLVAVGVVGEFLVDRISGPVVKRRDAAQQAEIARLNKETATARESASKAEAQATQAGEGTAKALANAAAANERAGKLEVEAALASKQAAEATKSTEQERIERLKLEAQIAPRRLTRDQQNLVAHACSQFNGHAVTVVSYAMDAEAAILAGQIIDALKAAGIDVKNNIGNMMPFGGFLAGVEVSGYDKDAVYVIWSALRTLGHLAVAPPKITEAPTTPDPSKFPVEVLIGVKPPTQ